MHNYRGSPIVLVGRHLICCATENKTVLIDVTQIVNIVSVVLHKKKLTHGVIGAIAVDSIAQNNWLDSIANKLLKFM